MTGTFDNLQLRIRYSIRKDRLMFRRKQKVVASRQNQGRYLDFAQPIHNRPALEQLAVPKDGGFGSHLGPGS